MAMLSVPATRPTWSRSIPLPLDEGPLTVVTSNGRPSLVVALARTLRPHQWAKNLLLVLPALAAHVAWDAPRVMTLIAGFIAFSALASSVYVTNDLVDLPHDRKHPTKRFRPIASGDVKTPIAIGFAVGLLGASLVLAAQLPWRFQGVLAGYLLLTTAYSFVLKRRAMMDVIVLASLYATRVVAGAVLMDVPLSRWFLAFSVFFFFSLALVKRVTELIARPPQDTELLAGRGYRTTDLPVLVSLGSAAVSASSLVYCLYITGDEVNGLYAEPDLLWLGLPIILYWQARIWMLANRQAIDEDPVAFALRDRMSYLLGIAFMVIVWVAT